MRQTLLTVGEPCPWFRANCTLNPTFQFHTTAGRYNVLCLFGSAANAVSRRVLDEVLSIQTVQKFFDIDNFLFTGVSIDPLDEREGRVIQQQPPIRWFWDFDLAISRQLGAAPGECTADGALRGYLPQTIVLDERLRVLTVLPFQSDAKNHVRQLMEFLNSLPRLPPPTVAAVQAPVLVIPRIFENELCRALMQYYERKGGVESGFMRDVEGKTVELHDYAHKRRTDCEIEDPKLRNSCMVRIHDRLVPEIKKAFQFDVTRMERYMVACYDAATQDHFRPHRDNTTKGTAHRRFAVSLVLNREEFEGGYVRFPEYGRQLYSPPTGGAVVFSCSLLHEATPVTAGRRFVFLPFLYDDAAALIREQNLPFIAASNPPPTPESKS